MAAPFHLARRSSLAPHRCPLLLSPCSLFPYTFPCVSLAVSSGISSCVSSHASCCVVSACRVVSPVRPVGSFRLSSRMGAVPLCCSLVLVSPVVAVLLCVPVPFRFALASRLSSRLVRRLVSRRLISSAVSFGFTRGCLGSVLVLGSRVRAVLSCCSLVPVRPVRHRFMFLVVVRGCASWSWGGRGLLFSSHPSHHHACSLLTHSLRDGSMGGCGIWGAVPCCSPLVPCPLMPHRSPHHVGSPSSSLRSFIPSSTKQESRGRKRRRRGNRTGTMKTRRIETRRLTRWIKRDARQDEDGTEMIRRTSKQRDAWTRRGNETGNETTSDKKRKTNNDGDWLMSFLLASTQHERRRDDEGNTFSSFRPTPSPQALSHPPASINPPPPGRGMSKQEDDLPCRRHEMMSGRERFGCAALSLIDRSLFPSHPFPVSSPPHIPRRFRKLILPCRL